MPFTTKTILLADQPIGRADRAVQKVVEWSHRKVRGLFDHGCVTINGEVASDPAEPVQSGDRIEVHYDPRQGYPEKKRAWVDRNFTIVFEDDDLLVVDKAANALTVATEHGERHTLESRVSHYLRSTGRGREALVVHRLDRGVSGLLVFAKSKPILGQLQGQFRQRKPDRRYVAIVAGKLERAAGTYSSNLETGRNLDQYSTLEDGKGQLAVTHYRVLKRLSDLTAVEVELETGRRNQIRVHFAEHGHPVLGDPRYGLEFSMGHRWAHNRMALHAVSLGFEHPRLRRSLAFRSELPNCMKRLIGN